MASSSNRGHLLAQATLTLVASHEHPSSDLVARLARGELAALGEAYDLHHAPLRSFARRLLGDATAAEDVVQETFLELPRAVRRYRGDATLRTFLLGVAANVARHHVRAAIRRRAAHAQSDLDSQTAESPEDRANRHELAQALTRALDALSYDQRLVIVLCEVEEHTAGEVARIVDAPEATIRTRLFHAKRKLREILAKEGCP